MKLKVITLPEKNAASCNNSTSEPAPNMRKQLFSSHSTDQNQAMFNNIYFPPDNISVSAGPGLSPSENDISGQTDWIPNRKIKNLHRIWFKTCSKEMLGLWKKEDMEGEFQMPVVHLVQRNVKERTADTPLILVNFFWGLRIIINLHSFIFHHQKYIL